MKKALLTLSAFATITSLSCKKSDSTSATKATITVNDAKGPVSGMTVYAYTEDTWAVSGDKPQFAEGQASSDANGRAIFNSLEYPTAFTSINNNQNNFRFSVHYTLNSTDKTKYISISVAKGSSVTGTISLN